MYIGIYSVEKKRIKKLRVSKLNRVEPIFEQTETTYSSENDDPPISFTFILTNISPVLKLFDISQISAMVFVRREHKIAVYNELFIPLRCVFVCFKF